jgi:hypothetical protein
LQSNGHHDASGADKGLTPTPSAACTCACTSEPENANAGTPDADQQDRPAGGQEQGEGTDQGDPLAKLAAALLDLTPVDRARLAAMLEKGT